MFGKKKQDSYVVPQNSKINLEQRSKFNENYSNLKENNYDSGAMNKCPHCENMAKNFLYLESLIRNNSTKDPKCQLCQSTLKYLQYVNRNIMLVFGNFDSIVHAARVFATQTPATPKYGVKKPETKAAISVRSEGGANLTSQKSKTLKSQKSKKSMKSIKSSKSMKSSKSGKSVSKLKKSSNATKSRISHGKKVLKSKYKTKTNTTSKLKKQLSHVVRSASQYQNLRGVRSKLAGSKSVTKKQKKLKRNGPPPTSINWKLLKRNMPQRSKPLVIS